MLKQKLHTKTQKKQNVIKKVKKARVARRHPIPSKKSNLANLRRTFNTAAEVSNVNGQENNNNDGDQQEKISPGITINGQFHRIGPSFSKQHKNPSFFTNPIFYVNGEPHLGHLYTTVLTETFKRWKKAKGEDSIVLSGTDEHGIKVQEAAEKAGFTSTKEFCDDISSKFLKTWNEYELQSDIFLRTTDQEHIESVQWMWRQLARNGHIYLGKHSGWYCKSDETFVPETQLIKDEQTGKYTTSSGHEVVWLEEENFKFRLSKFIQPLLDYYKSNPSLVLPEKQMNAVFNIVDGMQDISISRLASKLEWSIDIPDDVDYFDESTGSYKKGFELSEHKHKVYVWLDALNIYITGARKAAKMLHDNQIVLNNNNVNDIVDINNNINNEPGSIYQIQKDFFKAECPQNIVNQHIADEYQKQMSPFWPASGHIVGKDILKFHAVYWPAFLMGCGLPLPRQVVAHGHWMSEGKKMSKSLGNVVVPATLKDKLGLEQTKYSLMRMSNVNDDGDFIMDNAISYVNSDLADTIGNLAMRCTGKAVLPDGKYPDPLAIYRTKLNTKLQNGEIDNFTIADVLKLAQQDGLFNEQDIALQNHISQLSTLFNLNMDQLRTDRAVQSIIDLGYQTNSYFAAFEPWKMAKQLKNPNLSEEEKIKLQQRLDVVLYHCIESVRICSQYLRIFVPQSADVLLQQLSIPEDKRNITDDVATFGLHPSLLNTNNNTDTTTEFSAHVSTVPFNKIIDDKHPQNGNESKQAKEGGGKKQKGGNNNNTQKQQQTPFGPQPDLNEEFYKLDLRIGRLTNIRDHPNADSLWLLDCFADEEEKIATQVVTNLKPTVSIEKMNERKQVMVYNLKPVAFRGEKSHAMLFGLDNVEKSDAATGEHGLAIPSSDQIKIGARLFLEGQGPVVGDVARINDKNYAKVITSFTRSDNGELLYNGKKVCAHTKDGNVMPINVVKM